MIREAVDELGEAPAPLFDPHGEGIDPKDVEVSLNLSSAGASAGGKKGGKVRFMSSSREALCWKGKPWCGLPPIYCSLPLS